jgi:nucleoside phosphorylase
LRARTEHILKASAQAAKPTYKHDLCILTALDTPELNAIRSVHWSWSSAKALDDVSFYYEGSYFSGDRRFSVVALAAPRMGMVASATAAYKAIDILRPKLLAMAGICAGIRDACELGDAIFADPCWDWQMGKKAEGGFEIAPDQVGAPLDVSQMFALLRQDRARLFQIAEMFQGEKPNRAPSIHIGPVATGSAVLADEATAGNIRDQQHRKLLGVDMELYGVYSAARDSSGPRPRTFGVKAVCDYADAEKSDKYQRYAAHVSAQVLATFAERFSSQLLTATP